MVGQSGEVHAGVYVLFLQFLRQGDDLALQSGGLQSSDVLGRRHVDLLRHAVQGGLPGGAENLPPRYRPHAAQDRHNGYHNQHFSHGKTQDTAASCLFRHVHGSVPLPVRLSAPSVCSASVRLAIKRRTLSFFAKYTKFSSGIQWNSLSK